MAQLTSIGSHLDLQGTTLARHAQLLDDAEGSNPLVTTTGGQGQGGAGQGSGTSGGAFRPNQYYDNHANLHKSFHRPKLGFSHYDGATDPLPWLNRCESYFCDTRTMAAEQVWLASRHLDDVVAEWYYSLEKEYGLLPWSRFPEFINLRFGLPMHSNPLSELKELHRTCTVEDYQRQFLSLLCRCEALPLEHQMNLFIVDLGELMHSDVAMQ
jgi:hypothetical protein